MARRRFYCNGHKKVNKLQNYVRKASKNCEAIWGTNELRFQTQRSHSEMMWQWPSTIPPGDFPFLVAAECQDPQRASVGRKRNSRASSSTPGRGDKWERRGASGRPLSSGPWVRLGRQATHSRQQNEFPCILLMFKKQDVSESTLNVRQIFPQDICHVSKDACGRVVV